MQLSPSSLRHEFKAGRGGASFWRRQCEADLTVASVSLVGAPWKVLGSVGSSGCRVRPAGAASFAA